MVKKQISIGTWETSRRPKGTQTPSPAGPESGVAHSTASATPVMYWAEGGRELLLSGELNGRTRYLCAAACGA